MPHVQAGQAPRPASAALTAAARAQGRMPTPEEIAVDPRMERVTAAILSSAPRFTAADVYDGLARLAGLAAAARTEFMRTDFLIVPSALHHYLVSGARLAACGRACRRACRSRLQLVEQQAFYTQKVFHRYSLLACREICTE